MEPRRNLWNERQKELREALKDPVRYEHAIKIFLEQHAMVHARAMSNGDRPTFDDEAWAGVTEEHARRLAANAEHSIIWVVWHIARIEDITMNVLVADGRQVFLDEDWQAKLNTGYCETGNAMTRDEIEHLSATTNMQALREYRLAVGRRTREIVVGLQPEDLRRKTPRDRLQRLLNEKSVSQRATGLLDYWGGLTVAGLLLMPPTRHNLVHLNEVLALKSKLKG